MSAFIRTVQGEIFGKDVKLSDIKSGNKVIMDYLKEKDGKLTAAIIKVLN